jgi:diguanylate cyclase (GGDEF)-like protein/PAS domain S-box-containing protein
MEQGIRRAATPSDVDVDPGHFRLLVRAIGNAGSAVLITDADERIVWANEAYSRLSGYSAQEILGSNPAVIHGGGKLRASYQAMVQAASGSSEPWRRELTNRRRDGTSYIADEITTPLVGQDGTITHFVSVLHDVTQSRRAQQQERALANRDMLTGLSSRAHMLALFNQAFREARQSQHLLALLFVDLDGFKAINDAHGHHIGDEVLRAFAARLQSTVRSSDTVARFGGDEFVILLPAISHRLVAARLGRTITRLASQPFAIGAERHALSASVGIALYPEHGIACESLLISADQAMYRAKRDGGGQYRWAEPLVARPAARRALCDDQPVRAIPPHLVLA